MVCWSVPVLPSTSGKHYVPILQGGVERKLCILTSSLAKDCSCLLLTARLMVGAMEGGPGPSQFSSSLGLKLALSTKTENWVFLHFPAPSWVGIFLFLLEGSWLPWFSRCFHKSFSCLLYNRSLLYIIAHSLDWVGYLLFLQWQMAFSYC